MTDHLFGGPWTEIKLDAVQYYLECYTKALTAKKFDLWYVDAFAGSGERTEAQVTGGGLFGPVKVVRTTLPGSAKRAMEIQPPFQHFVFNDSKQSHREALDQLKQANPAIDIEVMGADANEAMRELFSRPVWRKRANGSARAVVFLDPYALQVNWDTLELLAATQCVDVWYLFPFRDVTRQLAYNISGIGPKEPKLDAVLSPAWRELYSLPPPVSQPTTLFGTLPEAQEEERRQATQRQIEGWFKARLAKKFAYVSEPLPLLKEPNRQTFSLFLAVANPSRPAIELAQHFHRHVMKNFAPGASRRKSGRATGGL